MELLLEMRDRYSEILSEQWVDIFNDIFREDNYTPICCNDEEEFSLIMSQLPLNDAELQQVTEHYKQLLVDVLTDRNKYLNFIRVLV